MYIKIKLKGGRGDSLCSIKIKMGKIKGSGGEEDEMAKSQILGLLGFMCERKEGKKILEEEEKKRGI